MYYVTMTDKFFSGWGRAENRLNKLVFECETLNEARIVVENAENRSDQKNINIRSTKPYYSSKKYLVQYKTKEDYPSWYEKGYFQK
jgi:hypothetical protein